MNKKTLAIGVVGVLGWYAWRSFNAIDSIRFDALNDEGGFLLAGYNTVKSDLEGYFVSSPNENLTPSIQLINFTKMYEEFKPYPYFATKHEESRGIQTVGYGHRIIKGDNFTYPMSRDFADKLFVKDLNKHIAQIYTKIKVRLTQNQFDALCDFCFNTGPYSLGNVYTGLLDLINAGDFEKAADRFMRYTTQNGVLVAGLMNRRYSEMNMFRFGKYERYTGFNAK